MAEASKAVRDGASVPASGSPDFAAQPHESRPDHRRRVVAGTLMVIAGACLWGISGTVSKLLMDRTGVSPLWMTNVKMLAGSAVFFSFAAARTPDLLRDAGRSLRHPRELLGVVGMSVMAYLVLNASYFANVDVTNPATATVLQSLGVPMTLAAVCLRRRRVPYGREVLCFAMAVAGTYLLATGGDPTTLAMPALGLALGLLTAAGQASESLLTVGYVERWGSLVTNALGFLVAGLLLLPAVRPWAYDAAAAFAPLDWFLLAFSVLVGTFGAGALYMAGLVRVGPVRTTLLSTTEQLSSAVSSWALVGTTFSPAELAGFAIITAMVALSA